MPVEESKIEEKCLLFRRHFRVLTSETKSFSESNLLANKKNKRCLKHQNQEEAWLKPFSFRDISYVVRLN